MKKSLIALSLMAGTATCLAQPTITSLGTGAPTSVTNNLGGTYYVGGSGGSVFRWSLTGASLTQQNLGATGGGGRMSADGQFLTGQWLNTGPQILGNTAAGVSPPFSVTPTLVPAAPTVTPPFAGLPAPTEFAARRYDVTGGTWNSPGGLPIVPSLMVYGSGSSGGTTGNFLNAHNISSDGRFLVGQGYVSSYNSSAGATITANTFTWRGWVWDAQANAGAGGYKILPTPFRTSTNTWRRRTGNAYAISTDGSVVAGAVEHNVSGTGGDSAILATWRLNAGTGEYDGPFALPTGAAGSTPGSLAMNAAGTIIVARTNDGTNSFIGRWTWNAGTQVWDGPENLGSNLTTPASWLPGSVTSCGLPPNIGSSLAMSEDGSIVVGSATYSTCGSFMTGGFIYHIVSGEPVMEDWYDYNAARGVPGVSVGGLYGPTGDAGDPTRGLPVLGAPVAISPDGTAFAGFQFGTQIIVGAPPWIMVENGPACVAPTITNNPTPTVNFSACSSNIILNVAALGTAPFTFQWYKDGNPLSNGGQPSGSNVTGADSFQLRVNPPLSPADAGTYYAVVTGGCGSPATSTNAVVQLDPAFPPAANDVCSSATTVVMGTNVLGAGESPCGAYINDPVGGASCVSAGTKSDRWYSFTPAASGNFRIETCGANFDTALSVFADCSGSELACNDNYTSGPTTGCTSSRSRVLSTPMIGGTPYLIRISAPSAAFLSGTSLMNMSITAAPLPAANDNCFTASTAVNGANAFDLNEATNDFVATCNPALSRDVWFDYTATATGNVRFTTCPGTLNTVLSIYDTCYGTELACNDNAVGIAGCTSPSLIDNFAVTTGTHYIIRVGTNNATTVGSGNLAITPQGCDSIDFNNDTSIFDPQDIDAFLSVYSEGPCVPDTATCSDIDFNNDTSVFDPCDIASFLQVYGEGACALCPV